jgi:hypothetical protein
LFGQDTTIVLENGSTVSGTIISETDSTYRIMGESWRVTDGVYEVFNTFINISKNETEGEAAAIVAKEEVEKQARVDAKEDFGPNVMLWGVTGLFHIFPVPFAWVLPVKLPENRQKALLSLDEDYQSAYRLSLIAYRLSYEKAVKKQRLNSIGGGCCIIYGTFFVLII